VARHLWSRDEATRHLPHYFFAGKMELDLGVALEMLARELRVKRLLLEGAGGANGALLRAGLIDEISLILWPVVDGAKGAPSVFDSSEAEAEQRAPIQTMTLESSRVLDRGAVWLRYRLENR
jgi:riboflavin biosynthesis pyrimidine reductase